MARQRYFRLITLLLFVSVTFVPAYSQDAPLSGFDNYVNKALREWEVPGLAIAIVKDDRIALAKGYGVRKPGDPPVGEKLKAVVPGQPVYTLVPVAANRFSIEGAPAGFFDQFELSEGKVKSLNMIQGSWPSLVLLPKQ